MLKVILTLIDVFFFSPLQIDLAKEEQLKVHGF